MTKLSSLNELAISVEKSIYRYLDDIFSNLKFNLQFPNKDVLYSLIRYSLSSILDTIMKQSPERIFFYVIDVMFAPNLVIRQVILILSLQATMIGSMALSKAMIDLVSNFTTKGRKMKKLQSMLENSKTYDEWVVVANELDVLYGYDKWRSEEYCPFFDYKSVSKRIRDTQDMMKKEDVFHLMFRLRGGLARDQYGIQHEGLFTRALAGTKHLVEKYHDTISSALERICDTQYDEDSIPTDAKLAFFNETRHAFGRTALLLSGGAFMGYYHLGVCKTLFQKHLLPRVISGASAGSLIAASVGTKTDEEFIITLSSREELLKNCYHFFKYSNEVKSETGRWLQYYTPKWLRSVVDPLLFFFFDKKFFNLDTEYFKSVVMDLAGLWTFQEAFDRTGRIINITVAPLNDYDPPRLLNYLTAPHVCVWSAAAASCALPGIFDSFQLIVKEPNGNYSPENLWTRQGHSDPDTQKSQGYSDGSLENDLPMKQLSELFNISHFIVSQVNPHSGLLSSLSMHTSVWSPALYGAVVSYIKFLQAQFRDWVKNVSNLLVSRSLAPVWSSKRGITQLLTQDYEGRSEDITIFPWKGHLSIAQAFLSVFKNPTEQEFLDVILAAERQTWPLLSRIQANLQVELTLDRCVQKLRKRVAEENENGLGIRQVMGVPEKTTIDRTPSFYTSRSIVNLSGLSVSDPLPYSSASHTMTPNIPSYIDYQQRLNNNVDDDALNLDVKGEDIPLAGDIPTFQHPGMKSPQHTIPKFLAPDGTRRRRRSNSNPMQYDSSNSNINGNNINTNININSNSTSTSTNTNSGNIGPLSMNEINLTEANVSNIPQTFGLNSPRRRNYSISSNDSNPGMYLSSTSQDQLDKYIDLLPESVSKDSRVKTTSMANFYYRSNTTSDDSLSKLK